MTTSSAAESWLRLRQIALMADRLSTFVPLFEKILALNVCHRDPSVAAFGLENVLFPIGNQFLEIVAPVRPDSAGARHLARHGGPAGYMVITQCESHAPYRAQVARLGVREVHAFEEPEFVHMQLHPRDTGGAFLEIDEQRGPRAHERDGPWFPAGPEWRSAQDLSRVTDIVAAEIACDSPHTVATRWSEILQLPLIESGTTPGLQWTLNLDQACLRFVPKRDERPDGLTAIDLAAADPTIILDTAAALGLAVQDNQLSLCGIRIALI